MDNRSKMFGEEKIGKLLFQLSIPIIISLLVTELYNMVDTYFVGNYVGAEGIGALVLVFPIQRIIIALSIMFGIGTSTSFSRANGEKNREKAKKVIENGFSITVVIMLAITILFSVIKTPVLKALGASDAILPYAEDYLGIIIFGSVFLSLTMFTSHLMISLGNSKISIVSTSLGAILNIIVDFILVEKMGWGVKGAAIATTTSQIVGFLYAYRYLRDVKKDYGIKVGINLDKKIFIPLLLVGISSFIIEAEDGILMAFINKLLATTVGDEGIIVLGVVSKVYMFLFITMFGISSAMQPIAAFNSGAKNYGRLKEVVKKTAIYACVSTAVLWALGMIFTYEIMEVFVKDPVIIEKSVDAFRIMILLFPLISIYYVSIFYYQAIGKPRHSVSISILRQIVIMLPLSIILVKSFNLGAMGVWLSYPISDGIVTVIGSVMMYKETKNLNIKIKESKNKPKTVKVSQA